MTGQYYHHGFIGGQPYFKLTTGSWYLWPTGPDADEWVITNARWELGTAYWIRSIVPIIGIYSPQGTATGNATVTVTV